MEKVRKNFKTLEALEKFIATETLPSADVSKKGLYVIYKRPIKVIEEEDEPKTKTK